MQLVREAGNRGVTEEREVEHFSMQRAALLGGDPPERAPSLLPSAGPAIGSSMDVEAPVACIAPQLPPPVLVTSEFGSVRDH